MLKKAFELIKESKKAFCSLKEYLRILPLLNRAELGEPLYTYFTIFAIAISSILVKEDEGI